MAQRRSLSAEFKERFEEQVGECLGLEQAAQKAVDDLEEHSIEEFAEGIVRNSYLGEKPQKLDALEFLCLAESHTFPGLEQACFIFKKQKHLECSKVYLATRKDSSPALHKACQAEQHGLKPPERK